MRHWLKLKSDRRGISSVEYGMIAGIVVAVIAVGFGAFSNQLSSQFSGLGNQISGGCGSGDIAWQSPGSGSQSGCIADNQQAINQAYFQGVNDLFNQYESNIRNGDYADAWPQFTAGLSSLSSQYNNALQSLYSSQN